MKSCYWNVVIHKSVVHADYNEHIITQIPSQIWSEIFEAMTVANCSFGFTSHFMLLSCSSWDQHQHNITGDFTPVRWYRRHSEKVLMIIVILISSISPRPSWEFGVVLGCSNGVPGVYTNFCPGAWNRWSPLFCKFLSFIPEAVLALRGVGVTSISRKNGNPWECISPGGRLMITLCF